MVTARRGRAGAGGGAFPGGAEILGTLYARASPWAVGVWYLSWRSRFVRGNPPQLPQLAASSDVGWVSRAPLRTPAAPVRTMGSKGRFRRSSPIARIWALWVDNPRGITWS